MENLYKTIDFTSKFMNLGLYVILFIHWIFEMFRHILKKNKFYQLYKVLIC